VHRVTDRTGHPVQPARPGDPVHHVSPPHHAVRVTVRPPPKPPGPLRAAATGRGTTRAARPCRPRACDGDCVIRPRRVRVPPADDRRRTNLA
jgi:hypothetical protein